MLYTLTCDNVSLDLSESSTRFTRHPHLLVAIATGMCLLATLIVVCHLLIIVVLIQHGYHKKYVNRNNKQESMSPVRQKLTLSNSLLHLVIAVFCMPLAIAEVVSNGKWTLSSSLCRVRIYVEVLTEVIRVFHSAFLWLEFFVLVRFPMRHRMMKSRSGYGIVVTVWVVPLLLLVVAVKLGWDTEGIGEDLYCLSQANKCVTFFSKKMVLMIFPLTMILCASIVIVMVVIVAFETHRRQGNLNKLKKRSNLIEADSHRLKTMKDTNIDSSDSDIKILAIAEKNSLDVKRLVALKHLNKINDSYGQVVEKTNTDSISVASSNIATSTTASKGSVSINTATSNTASSNTASSNTATSNTASSNTASSNTATLMTASTISVSFNADSSLTTSNYSISINEASSTTASNNSVSIKAVFSTTASTISESINAASSTTASANSVSINTASLNAASFNKASSIRDSTNTAYNVLNQSDQSRRLKSAEADLTFGSRTNVSSDNVGTISRQRHSKKTTISQNFIDTSVSTTVNASSINKKVKAKAKKNTKCVGVVILVTVVNCIYLVTSLLISVLLTYDTTLFPLWLISLMTGLRYLVVATMPIYTMRHKYFTKLFCTFKVFTHRSTPDKK